MDYDEKWDEKIKNNLTDEEYDYFLKTIRKISEELI